MASITNDALPVDAISDSVLNTVMKLRYLKENGVRSHKERKYCILGPTQNLISPIIL